MVELARWLLERKAIAYWEEAHAPILHAIFSLRAGGGVELPVIVGPQGVWKGPWETLVGLDALGGPGERLFGDDEVARTANIALIRRLLSALLPTVRRYVYYHLLPHKELLYPVVVEAAPAWERSLVYWCYPLWRIMMSRALGSGAEEIAEARGTIAATFGLIEDELTARGSTFVAGPHPGTVDIVFSALAAPVIFPKQYGSQLPAVGELPAELVDFVRAMRQHRGGRLVLATYEAARIAPGSAVC